MAAERDGSLWRIVPAWSLSDLAALLRQQLFVYRDPFVWIDQLFQPPLLDPTVEQLALSG